MPIVLNTANSFDKALAMKHSIAVIGTHANIDAKFRRGI